MRIQHFSHQHQLVLGEQQSNENGGVRCSGCNEPVIGTAYSCTSCQFYLHKKCAHLPFTIHHSLHPQHVLTLLAKPPYPEGRYKCDMCHNAREGFLYHCSCCYFDLDINCAFIHPKITSQIDASRDNKIIPMASAKPIAFEGKAMEEKKHMQGGSPGILLQSIVQGYQSSSGSPDFGLFPFDWPISEEENIDKGEASKHAIPGEKSNFEPYQGKDIVEKEKKQQGQTKKSSCKNPSPIIFRTPFPKLEFQKPELVSIGPYHRDEEHPLDKYKHFFLEKYLSRTSNDPERNLCFYVGEIIALEKRARACYSEDFVMSSRDFVKMMLVDGCFTIELLLHFGGSEDYLFPKDPVSIIMPWQIPILVQDLLLLDNQIPFFVLEKLLDLFKNHEGKPEISLTTMALKFFDLAFPRSSNLISEFSPSKPNHLLDLFLMTIRPSNPRNSISHLLRPANRGNWTLDLLIQIRISDLMEAMSLATISTNREETENQALSQLEKSVAKLREAGIEFMPSRLNSFLDVNFKDGVIEIPIVTINKLFITLLVNAMVLECFSSNHKDDDSITKLQCEVEDIIAPVFDGNPRTLHHVLCY
ncbi:hypothetical protein PTKIN_Ptkin14bG0079700 [Pterospermum kingtungense]